VGGKAEGWRRVAWLNMQPNHLHSQTPPSPTSPLLSLDDLHTIWDHSLIEEYFDTIDQLIEAVRASHANPNASSTHALLDSAALGAIPSATTATTATAAPRLRGRRTSSGGCRACGVEGVDAFGGGSDHDGIDGGWATALILELCDRIAVLQEVGGDVVSMRIIPLSLLAHRACNPSPNHPQLPSASPPLNHPSPHRTQLHLHSI